ncbi:38548_t:CDS:1, partial [Gigaspora margarita]
QSTTELYKRPDKAKHFRKPSATTTSTKETFDAIRALTHVYQEGFYKIIWVKYYNKICKWKNSTGITRAKKRGAKEMRSSQRTNLQELARKKRKPNDKTEPQNSNIWKSLKEKLIKTKKLVCETLSKQIFSFLPSVW